MRRDQILKLCCNHLIVKGMALTARDEKSFQWITLSDLSEEEAKRGHFTVRFKLEETASTFQRIFNDCLSNLYSAEKATEQSITIESASQATNLWERQSCCVRNEESVTKCIACGGDHNPVTSVNNNVTSSVASVNTSTVTATKEEPIVTTTSTTKDQPSVTSCSAAMSTALTLPPVTTNSTTPATNPPTFVCGSSSNLQSKASSPPIMSWNFNINPFNFASKPALCKPFIFGSTSLEMFNDTTKANTTSVTNVATTFSAGKERNRRYRSRFLSRGNNGSL